MGHKKELLETNLKILGESYQLGDEYVNQQGAPA
jgi:hypothetical protein